MNSRLRDPVSFLASAPAPTSVHRAPALRCVLTDWIDSRLSVLEFTHDAVLIRDCAGIIVFWNAAAEAVYGWSKQQAIGAHAGALLDPASQQNVPPDARQDAVIDAALARTGVWEGERTHMTRSGGTILVASRCILQRDGAGTPIAIMESNHDISERKAHEDRLRSSARLLQAVMDSTASYIHVRGRKGEFLYVNKEYEKVFGVTADSVIGKTIEQVFSGEVAATRRKMHETVMATGTDLHAEIVEMQPDGRHTYLDVKSPLFDEDGNVYAVYCLGTDITERKAAEARMHTLAHYDAMTGLPNRALFFDRLQVAVAKAKRTDTKAGLLYLDLNRFKEINDVFGHASGDLLLIEAGRRIRACVRASDTVARIGGDEFTVLVEGLKAATDAAAIAEKIVAAFAAPFNLGGVGIIGGDDLYLSTSIGITICPDDGESDTVLLKNADQAMYRSKRIGGNQFCYFTPAMHEAAATRLRIASDLRSACQEEQFSLAYQPIVDLRSGAVHKAEALLRWQHPVRGLINPADFIPVSEETGLIVPIGDWVFRQAARQCMQWRQLYDPDFEISINTSPVQYRGNGIDVVGWMRHLTQLGLAGSGVTIEITEGLLMDASDAVKEQFRLYRNAGMRVSLDDFGTGYSSLSYLRKFDVDFIKIDRSFVSFLAPESDDLALCEAIIVMAHKLGIKVVAEGIETALQRDLLLGAGCDFGQGYFFARPQSAADFGRLLASGIEDAANPTKG